MRRLLELAGIFHRTATIKEGEDDLFGGEDEAADDEGGGDDLFGGDEEETGDDAGGDEEGDDEGAEGGEDTDAEEPEAPPVTQADIEKYGSSIDQAITDVFDEIAIKAEKSAVINAPKVDGFSPEAKVEAIMSRFENILLEQEEDEPGPRKTQAIDMDVFAREVARLVNNYENLLDMESIIVNHAKRYLVSNYSEDILVDFEDMLQNRYEIDLTSSPAEETEGTGLLEPIAIGAGGGEGSGGGI